MVQWLTFEIKKNNLSILKLHFPYMAAVTGESPVRELIICVRNRCVFLGFVLINPIQTETIFVGS